MKPSTPHTDQERVLNYLNNQMSTQERYDFEAEMIDNQALSDAVDGAEMLASPAKSIARLKKRTSNSFFIKWVVGIAVICLLVAVFFVLDHIQKPIATSAATDVHQVQVQRHTAIPAEHNDSTFSFVVEVNSAIDHQHANSSEIERWREAIEVPNTLEKKRIAPLSVETERNIHRVFGNDAIYHIQNYKVVDYREIRAAQADAINSGLPADNRWGLVPGSTAVSYVDFLEETMQLFAEGKYERALAGFKAILNHFPEDANAQFYGGMAALEVENNALAVSLFLKSTQNVKMTFYEEGCFYLATARMLNDEHEAACLDFTTISNQNGFYAERAKKELERHCK